MKVELQAGDIITIPEGCKPVIKDGSVIFEKEVPDFKDGDILISYFGTLLIFKEHSTYERFTSYYNTINFDNKNWSKEAFHYANEEEKQRLFNKMKEQGLRWNAEEKKVEKIRWRANKGGKYYRMGLGNEIFCEIDSRLHKDEVFYDVFNYFKTEEQAEEAIKRREKTLRKYHEEIGE